MGKPCGVFGEEPPMDFFFRAADHRFKDADLRERPSEPGQHLVRALLMGIQPITFYLSVF
jgi:hypothetical protein